jgi:hypothetical protein
MVRHIAAAAVFALLPAYASAQQCTSEPQAVVDEIYRQLLERPTRNDADVWVTHLRNGSTVREVVRLIAHSDEYAEVIGRAGTTLTDRQRTAARVHESLVGRTPSNSTLRSHADLIRNGDLKSVVDQVVSSPEYNQVNGDWRVPGSEVRFCETDNSRNNTGGWRARTRGAADAARTTAAFDQADRNRDGRITFVEWEDSREAFRQADRNRDNALSRVEFDAATGASAPVGTSGTREEEFDYLDANGNNRIELGEWRGSRDAFNRLDRNGNGWLSRGEAVGNNNNNNNNNRR